MDRVNERTLLILLKGNHVFRVAVGDSLEGLYRIDAVHSDRIEVMYLPMEQKQVLTLTSILPRTAGIGLEHRSEHVARPGIPEPSRPLSTESSTNQRRMQENGEGTVAPRDVFSTVSPSQVLPSRETPARGGVKASVPQAGAGSSPLGDPREQMGPMGLMTMSSPSTKPLIAAPPTAHLPVPRGSFGPIVIYPPYGNGLTPTAPAETTMPILAPRGGN